jgi:hypothetical protein
MYQTRTWVRRAGEGRGSLYCTGTVEISTLLLGAGGRGLARNGKKVSHVTVPLDGEKYKSTHTKK